MIKSIEMTLIGDNMSSGTTVVLGWDGLDTQLVRDFDIEQSFGEYNKQIETFDNEVLGKPQTMELWPTMITGLKPAEHGFRPPSMDTGKASWENDNIDMLSELARGVIPQGVRTWIGARLKDTGAELDRGAHSREYADSGIDTVFDDRTSVPINIPNYRSEIDEHFGIESKRGGLLTDYLNNETVDGSTKHTPNVPLPEIEIRLEKWLSFKLGLVETSIYRNYDLIFVWLSYIDTVGHLDPLTEGGWQKRAYMHAARKTRQVATLLSSNDTLVCVSDHGLQNGAHNHNTFVSSTDERVLNDTHSIVDLRQALDRVTPSSGELSGIDDYPPLKDRFKYEQSSDKQNPDRVQTRLEDLGYI